MNKSVGIVVGVIVLLIFLGLWAAFKENEEQIIPIDDDDSPATQEISLFFLNEDRFAVGTEPYEDSVNRSIPASSEVKQAVISALYDGPTADETDQSLRMVYSESTGARVDFDEATGTASVYLESGCNSAGATYTVANLIIRNLEQFSDVNRVIIYDPEGETLGSETDIGNLVPACLQP
jgi:hypothetical protein